MRTPLECPHIGGWQQDTKKVGRDFGVLRDVIGRPGKHDEYAIKEFTPISNQGRLSSCVGNGVADALEILIGLERGSVPQLSRLFVYWNARQTNGHSHEDKGTQIHLASSSLQLDGICKEEDWPYDYTKVNCQPSIWAYENAHDNKITGVYDIDADANLFDNIIASIDADHPVVFGTSVGPEFRDYWYGDPAHIKTIDTPTTITGNHCMIIVGYRFRVNGLPEFYIRNSHGPEYGVNGHFYMTAEYMANPMSRDFTVLTRAPNM